MKHSRNIELAAQPPTQIQTILDLNRGEIYSTHEVFEFLGPDALTKQAIRRGEANGKKSSKEADRSRQDSKTKHKGH